MLNHLYGIQNGPFIVKADSVKTFEEKFDVNSPVDVTILSVAPHAHLIAKEWLCYAVTPSPAYDTIPLIKIDDWDFHWQGSYAFRNLMKIPKQSKLYAFCKYDNTVNNSDNPNHPPQDVTLGEATTDEMMLVYFAYTIYQQGDENIVVDGSPLVDITDTSIVSGISEERAKGIVSTPQLYDAFPNPAADETTFGYFLPQNSRASIRIFDLSGRLIEELKAPGNFGFNSVKYNTAALPAGEYVYSLIADGQAKAKRLIVNK
jgi:hypothetical protein